MTEDVKTMAERKPLDLKCLLADILLWCALFAFTAFSAANAAALKQYPNVSLRYETPVSGQAVYRARQYAIEHREETTFWPTFWIENTARFSAEFKEVTADCITYSGEAALVWIAEYIAGGAPGVTDGTGCAISAGLAWELWGDIDVIGKTVEVDGAPRIVRGVFDGVEPLALLSVRDEDRTQSFTTVELSGGPASPSRSDAVGFVTAAGLGTPDSVLMGSPAVLAELIALLPLAILIIYGLALCINKLKKRSAVLRRILIFSLCLGAALLLPGFLELLPDWLIPTRWSDFSFWGGLFGQVGENLREYLALYPSLRDVGYKTLFFKQIGLVSIAAGLALSICFRRHGKRRFEMLKRRIDCG